MTRPVRRGRDTSQRRPAAGGERRREASESAANHGMAGVSLGGLGGIRREATWATDVSLQTEVPSDTASAASDGVNIVLGAGVNQVITNGHVTCLSEVT